MPPFASGASMPIRPISVMVCHRASSRGAPVSSKRRKSAGVQLSTSISRAASLIALWSSVKAKNMAPYPLGRPSMRSAMMLRWISFEPA